MNDGGWHQILEEYQIAMLQLIGAGIDYVRWWPLLCESFEPMPIHFGKQ